MKPLNCEDCYSPYCYEKFTCFECDGTGILNKSDEEDNSEDQSENKENSSELPCQLCNGEGEVTIYCPDYFEP